jgi:LTXXQ motif family protein
MKTSNSILAVTIIAASLAGAGSAFAHGGMGAGAMGMGAEHPMGQRMMGAGHEMGHGMMGMGQGMGHGHMGHGHMGMGAGMHAGMGPMQGPEAPATVSARLADSKAQLKITSAQEAAWSKYAALVTQQAEAHANMRTQMHAQMSDPKTASTADHAAQRETMHKFKQDNLAARNTALTDLYAVLTPEQKTVADRRLQGPRGHRMAGHMPGK